MKNIRIGKDIALKWTVTVDGVSRDLSELDLKLFLHNETAGSAVELAFTTQTDVLRAEVLGRDQRNTGVYRLTLWLNKDKIGQSVLDESTAFRLVARTEMEGGVDDNNLETESVELSGNLTTDGYKDYSELSERVEVLEEEMPVSLDAESSPETSWLLNKNYEAVIEIGGATMQRNGFMTTNHVEALANASQKNAEQDARLSAIERDMPNYALDRSQAGSDYVSVLQANGSQADIGAATTENAGVMSAEQVQSLNNKAEASSVPASTTNATEYVAFNNANGAELFRIPYASPPNSGIMSVQQAADLAQAKTDISSLQTSVAGKQDKVTLVEVSSQIATLTPAIDTYTRLNAAVGTLEVTLPAINSSTNTYAVSLMIYMETGASPAVTFVSADNRAIVYYDGFALDANAKYEVSALFNGSKWVLANGTIA